ncbi:hypothetical protein RchiOBHm_Chr5g0062651 [Rosa chinensis]|uniref:Uncharacterized protein n=1 Tax=Rosa chinensis TaxID=74649 RepID=A0A2P6QI80_ROSCH|nr:hypothetical protein RchiOBHm_Chr5g0062651 [Rosa chinensis]
MMEMGSDGFFWCVAVAEVRGVIGCAAVFVSKRKGWDKVCHVLAWQWARRKERVVWHVQEKQNILCWLPCVGM